jgi:hypothetical protein
VRDDVQTVLRERDINADELEKIKPVDLAKRYAEDINSAFTPEMEVLFNEIMKLVDEDKIEK